MKTIQKNGFTLIELTIVVCIIAFLSTIAVTVYRRFEASRYDTEGLAGVEDLYAQALRIINDRGVSTASDTSEVHTGCVVLERKADGTWGKTQNNNANFAVYLNDSLISSTSVHWKYQVCIGFADSTEQSESFIVSAHSLQSTRTIIASAGLDTPIIADDSMDSTSIKKLMKSFALYPSSVVWKSFR